MSDILKHGVGDLEIPADPKERWYKAHQILRMCRGGMDPDWVMKYYPAHCYAQSQWPKDPLTRRIYKRLSIYKNSKIPPEF